MAVADYQLTQIRKRFAERRPNSYAKVMFGIETLVEGTLIGSIALRDADPETARAEVDLYAGEEGHWGGGYGTDALRALCRYGFEVMRLHSIALWVVAENKAAIHV